MSMCAFLCGFRLVRVFFWGGGLISLPVWVSIAVVNFFNVFKKVAKTLL